MTLQDNLDYFKTHKVPDKTVFDGHARLLTRNPSLWKEGHEGGGIEPSGAIDIPDRFPQYVLLMSRIKTVSELLDDLSKALEGKSNVQR